MRIFPSLTCAICILSATLASAQSVSSSFSCRGSDPDWSLSIDAEAATFDFLRTSAMTVALETQPQNADWPRAVTLIGRGDSAIVILENQTCETGNITARVLTQRGETPVFLTGCCDAIVD